MSGPKATSVLSPLYPPIADVMLQRRERQLRGQGQKSAAEARRSSAVSLHVPVMAGKLALGTWQGIYLVEHRTRRHSREVVLQFIGSRQQR